MLTQNGTCTRWNCHSQLTNSTNLVFSHTHARIAGIAWNAHFCFCECVKRTMKIEFVNKCMWMCLQFIPSFWSVQSICAVISRNATNVRTARAHTHTHIQIFTKLPWMKCPNWLIYAFVILAIWIKLIWESNEWVIIYAWVVYVCVCLHVRRHLTTISLKIVHLGIANDPNKAFC